MTGQLTLRTLGEIALVGPDDQIVLRRRIDLALLTVVCDRAPAAVKREELQALFWGERSEERSRHSLRQVVLRLRKACGDAIDVRDDTIRIAAGALDLDTRHFTEAVRAGQWRTAITLWRGQFLPACEDVGIDGFRTWLEVERERLRRLLAHAFERAASELSPADGSDDAVDLTGSWAREFPMDAAAALRHVQALSAAGRVAEADAARAAFTRYLETELQETPGDEWLDAANAMLAAARVLEPAQRTPREEPTPPPEIPARSGQRRRWLIAGAVAAACIAIFFLVRGRSSDRTSLPPLAVGDISSSLPPDSAHGFAMLLTINLGRIAELNVISERRVSEVASAHPGLDMESIARAAGARQLIDGVLSRRADNSLRADLRRIDLETGATRASFSIEAADLTTLADLITEHVARDLGVKAAASRREGVTTSLVAYRLYEQGLRAWNDGDSPAAQRFFTAALAEDSTFAMAAFYNGLAIGGDGSDEYLARAARLAERTSDRERLLIAATWGRRMSDPRALAWAETLLTRYPSETEAHLLYAHEMAARRNFAASLAHYRHVVEMDTAGGRSRPTCRACDGLSGMMHVYSRLDSTDAEERLARLWVRWQPRSPQAWTRLSGVLGAAEQYDAAHAAIDSAAKYSADPSAALEHTVWWFRTNQFAEIDRLWQELARSAKPDVRMNALWTAVISLRTQGRMREALAAAREFRRQSIARGAGGDPDLGAAMLEAITLMDAGRSRESAELFASIARVPQAPFPSRSGAHRAMYWLHTASAYAASGDTSRLAALEDSVRISGALATDRHKVLYHHVRGLRLAAARRPADAVEAFGRALHEPAGSYVRIYLEQGRALLATGQPTLAIAPLATALTGPTSASGIYATRTELQILLGEAYERSRQPDSAVVQYNLAAHAWRNADASFAARRAALQERIRAVSRLSAPSALR